MKMSTYGIKNNKKNYAPRRASKSTLTSEILAEFCTNKKENGKKKINEQKLLPSHEKKTEAEVLTFQSQAFDIEPPGPEFDPNTPPTNGKEFLMQMLYERERCPAIVKCQSTAIPKTANIRNAAIEEKPVVLPDTIHKKTPEWINAQICTFLQARSKITLLRLNVLDKTSEDNLNLPTLAKSETEWQNFCRSNLPILSIMLRFSQVELEKLLEWLSEWLNKMRDNLCISDDKVKENVHLNKDVADSVAHETTEEPNEYVELQESDQEWLGAWIYGTFACLQLPLEPHVHSTLREIARSCISLRSKLKPIPYNSFIVLIIFVFRQHDFKEYI